MLTLQRLNENRWRPFTAFLLKFYTMFPAAGALQGTPYPVTGAVLWRGLKFQTCTNILNTFFVTIPEISGSPLVNVSIVSNGRNNKVPTVFFYLHMWNKSRHYSVTLMVSSLFLGHSCGPHISVCTYCSSGGEASPPQRNADYLT